MFQLLNTFKEAPTFKTLDEFLQTATQSEKDLVEKTMKLIYAKDEAEGKDAVKNVEKWLCTASVEGVYISALCYVHFIKYVSF